MGNVCLWRQGKGKLDKENVSGKYERKDISDFKLKKGEARYNVTDNKQNNLNENKDEENKKTDNEKDNQFSTTVLNVEDLSSAAEETENNSDDDKEKNKEEDAQKDQAFLELASKKEKRLSVSAEAYGEWNKKNENFVVKVYKKDEEEKKKLREAINESFLFNHLNEKEIETIINAFFEKKVEKGYRIINEGEEGDLLYVINKGEVEIYKTKIISPEKENVLDDLINDELTEEKKEIKKKEVLTLLKSKDVFGELALLYNAKRAATVEALTDCSLWALDRESFNYIIKESVAKNRELYEEMLQQIYILKDMNPYERSKLADCLKSQTYSDGDLIIKEGEKGDTFYILIDGNAIAMKNGITIKTYNKGDYFGELALLKNQPRAATVQCKGYCQVVFLDRKSFKRLLGPIEEILNRNVNNYKQVLKQLGLDTTCIESNEKKTNE